MKTTGSIERSTDHPTGRTGPIAAFVRFVVCGGGVGLLSSAVLLLLSGRLPLVVANALVTVASTLLATELHGRFTFRAGRAQLSDHVKSGATAAICYLFTTAALLVLHAVHPSPGPLLEQSVYLSASGLAGVGRFVVLRVIVFAKGGTRTADVPVATPATGRAATLVATPSAAPSVAPSAAPSVSPSFSPSVAPAPALAPALGQGSVAVAA
ncbi:GtrA family protein [Streptomyces sp. RKAG337]|uniref:GtrA family protein n=1 Tax=Streptomyces sp. RKAG337 TaxID=2893404 RepID=UPI0020332775|nr:GtrA family protein [Streptomyces sp. RKAG337]MCM2427707.1 GtrA family protein [Streptomyces sp. RKAG337]